MSLNRLRDRRTVSIGSDSYRLMAASTGPQEEKENAEWLDRRMAALPTAQYTILYMRQVERRSNREIAALLGISDASVATLLSRARKALLKELRTRL